MNHSYFTISNIAILKVLEKALVSVTLNDPPSGIFDGYWYLLAFDADANLQKFQCLRNTRDLRCDSGDRF